MWKINVKGKKIKVNLPTLPTGRQAQAGMPVSSFGYALRLKKFFREIRFIVVDTRIDARLSILDIRASLLYEHLASIPASSPITI